MMKKLLLIYFLFSLSNVQAFDMLRYLNKTASYSNTKFIQSFPYNDYLRTVEFTDFKTLQDHRYLIYKRRDRNDNIGDRFIYQLAEKFLQLYPIDRTDFTSKIIIAELFLKAKPGKNYSTNVIYKTTGLYILGQIAKNIEEDIKNKKIDANNPSVKQIIARLNNNHVNISIEVSKTEKVIKSIKKGNYKYLSDRILLKLKEHLYPLSDKLSVDISIFLTIISVVFILMFLLSKITRRISLGLITVIMLTPLFLKGEVKKNKRITTLKKQPTIKLSATNFNAKETKIFNLINKDKKIIGQTIWMDRSIVKASYIATGNVYNKYLNLKNNKHIILASAGGFTNQKGFPLGLTIENGKIANAVLRHDRDGLILVTKKGGIRVLNLKRKEFRLPGLNRAIKNPLNSLLAYSDLLNWATKYKATIFQVQLLAYSNKLLIDPQKAPNQLRERRILVLFSDNVSGKVYHAIYNIESSYNLAVITDEIFSITKSRNKKIEAILNLDVGSYNILNVFDRNGNMLQQIKGPVNINTATNLLVYTR